MRNLLASLNTEDIQSLLEASFNSATESAEHADEEAIGLLHVLRCSSTHDITLIMGRV